MPARRSGSPRPRASSPSWSPAYLLGLYLAQVRGTQVRRRDRARGRRARRHARPRAADPRQLRPALRPGRGARRTRRSVLFLGRHVGLPGRARGRAQAQGARLHPRRGLRGRRAQARPDRADRARAAGLRASCRRRAATSCTTRWSATSRRSGPAARARSCWPRRTTTRSRRSPTTLIRLPRVSTLLQPLVGRRAAAGVRLRAGDPARPRRRPAAQPGQVRHRRVDRTVAIVGVGIDVVDIERFEDALRRTPGLAARLFTPGEIDRPPASLAARFAAKEALAKALGAPGGMAWHDAEVVRTRRAGRCSRSPARWPPAPPSSAPRTSTSRSPTTPASPRRSSSWSA